MKRACNLIAVLALAAIPSSASAQTTQTYLYDSLGRMVGMARVGSYGSDFAGYAFDSANNRTLGRTETRGPLAATDVLASGEQMVLNQALKSADGRMTFVTQGDGNLVVYFGNTPLWASGTGGTQGLVLAMQTDGNLVLYGPNSAVIWHAGTYGHPGARLVMQSDGNLVIYDSYTPLWSSGTSGH